jgi:hypothetical protein
VYVSEAVKVKKIKEKMINEYIWWGNSVGNSHTRLREKNGRITLGQILG